MVVYPAVHHWHLAYAALSLCACAFVNENDREKECYAELNERNDIYVSKWRKKIINKSRIHFFGARC